MIGESGSLPKAMLLDLDDTIIAFGDAAVGGWRDVCARFAARLGGFSSIELLNAFQQHRTWYWTDRERNQRGRMDPDMAQREVVAGTLSSLGLDSPSLANDVATSYSECRDSAIQLFPHVIETLSHLQGEGVRMALVTNGNATIQRGKVERFGLAKFFEHIQIEGEFGAGKPNDTVYFHALDQLGCQPAEAWMVGDNLELDVAAPQRLGIVGIWVDASGNGVPESSDIRPDRVIRSLSELVEA